MASFIGQDPLNSLTNLYSRPILINAIRDPRDINTYPTSADIYPAGTQWENSSTTPATLWKTSGNGYWYKGDPQNVAKLTGNTGFAVVDSNQNINILGTTGQIDVTGSGSTLTISLTGGSTAVDSFQPDTGTNPVVPTTAGLVKIFGQVTPNVSGIRVTGGTNEVDIAMFSPFEGDFAFTQSSASSNTNRKITVSNADTANSGSNAQLIASVGGTSSGDAHAMFAIASSRSWSIGADTSASGSLKITTTNAATVTPSSGTTILESDTAGLINIPNTLTLQTGTPTVPGGSDAIPLSVNEALVGATLAAEIFNTDNSNVGSRANLNVRVGGSSAGDPVTSWIINGATIWTGGADNSASDSWKLSASVSLGTDDVIVADTSKLVTLPNNTLGLAIGTGGPTITSGSGAPGTTQPKGSLYLNTAGSGVNDRAYIATDSAGAWTAIVTVA